MKKFILGGIAAAILVVGILVFRVIGNLDQIVEQAIESVGTELTGVPVGVGGVAIDLGGAQGQITALTIANPDGYDATNAFDMNLLRVGLDVEALTGGVIGLKELVIEAPVVNLEVREDGSSNLQTIADSVASNVGSADESAPESETADGEPPQLSIDSLVVTGVTFNIVAPGIEPASGTLPDIGLNNLSGTPAEIGKVVITELTSRILREAAENYLRNQFEQQLDNAKDKLLDKIRG